MMAAGTTEHGRIESLDDFRERARSFVRTNLPPRRSSAAQMPMSEARALQAVIFDSGFAGIALPSTYGGAGLTLAHQKVWAEEVEDRLVPVPLFVSVGMLGPTLVDHGSETLKSRHVPRILRGDEVWIQLLSEPSGGSDMAAALTRASRDGGLWTINGSKVWSTGADQADYGMCLARTDWDAPKHKGLSMFALPLRDPRVTIEPIVGAEGGRAHFFQEFLDDVALPLDHLIGGENEGWSVAHTLLFHERNATAGVGHGYGLGGSQEEIGPTDGNGVEDLVRYAQSRRDTGNPAARRLVAEAFAAERARQHGNDRIAVGMSTGAFKGDWGSLLKLGLALDTLRRAEIGLELAAADGVIWSRGEPEPGEAGRAWLTARSISIAGGTNEMQRNIVSERLLGLPREPAADRDQPFSEVLRRRRG